MSHIQKYYNLLKVIHTFKVIDLKYIYGQKKFLSI